MRKMQTNLALLMELTQKTPDDLARSLEVDLSLVSRWKTGNRRLLPGHKWAARLAGIFMRENPAIVEALLREAAPVGLTGGISRERLLASWLCAYQDTWEFREELLFVIRKKGVPHSGGAGRSIPKESTIQLSGEMAAQSLLVDFLDYALTRKEPGKILFACPDGLSIFTRNEAYNLPLQDKLQKALRNGHRLYAILRTDYRPSDVAIASGPWLKAHLMGLIQSYYYDDFRLLESTETLVILQGVVAVRIRTERSGELSSTIGTVPQFVESAEAQFAAYLHGAKKRFHYHFFQNPDDFLCGVSLDEGEPTYLFQRLPHFGVSGDFFSRHLQLPSEEQVRINTQFPPLAVAPAGDKRQSFHLFCADSIEDALDKSRHLCKGCSEILGRRLYLSTQGLIDQLLEIQRLIDECPGYHVCFVSAADYERIGMEIGVWGRSAAIAWISGRASTACRDYPNVCALHGYCATVWNHFAVKGATPQAAHSKIGRWLKRAKKFGLKTERTL